ncbi:MAG: OprO/OprP family phosphate-selective porin [Thermoguttaceae bacterium]
MGSQSLLYRSLFGAAALTAVGGTTLLGADLVPRYYGGPARVALRMDDAPVDVNLQETVVQPQQIPVADNVPAVAVPPAPIPMVAPALIPMAAAPAPVPMAPSPMVVAPPPAPVQVVVAPSVDPAQLAYLEGEIAKIKADMKKTVKAPDTKKGWSTPKIGGRIFLDSVNYAQQDAESARPDVNGDLNNMLGVSDARIAVSGTGYDNFDYKIELGIGSLSAGDNGQISLRDLYFGVKNLPILNNVRVGNFRPETTMAYSVSPTVIPTLNYTNPSSAFAYGRRLGVTSTHFACDQKMRLMIGVFQGGDITTSRSIVNDNQSTLFVTRFTATPIYAQEGKYLLHIGGNYSHHSPTAAGSSAVSVYQANLNTQTGSIMVNTDPVANGSVHQGALEFIAQYKSLGAAGEVYLREVTPYGTRRVGRTATGAWLEGRWVVTGESRAYDKDAGVIGAIKPKNNFHALKCRDWNLVDGIGAIELAVQWSYADTTDWRGVRNADNTLVKSGQLNEMTFATNWVWSQHVRWITQYTRSWQDLAIVGVNHVATTDMIGCGLHVNW